MVAAMAVSGQLRERLEAEHPKLCKLMHLTIAILLYADDAAIKLRIKKNIKKTEGYKPLKMLDKYTRNSALAAEKWAKQMSSNIVEIQWGEASPQPHVNYAIWRLMHVSILPKFMEIVLRESF